MHAQARTFQVIVVAAALSVLMAAQSTRGRITGVVADESGGVLPGVTVTARAADGKVLDVAVSTELGRFAFELPAGRTRLEFTLEGFSTALLEIDVKPGVAATLGTERLTLAPRSETVTVQGHIAAVAPSAPEPQPLPPPPPPAIVPLPEHDPDSICGPARPGATPESLGVIHTARSPSGSTLFAKNDQVIIEGGTLTGLSLGQNVVARRTFRVGSAIGAIGEHTAGVLQIVSVQERSAVGVVIYTCDEMMPGDWVAAFAAESVRAPEPAGMPAFDDAAQILFADEGQLVGAPRGFMVIDRGRTSGVHAGQRLTLFRREARGARRPVVVGDAVVVAVREDSATIRIETASDAIEFGDWAAPQRTSDAHPR